MKLEKTVKTVRATVIYSAVIESVVVRGGEDVLTKEQELSGSISVEFPSDPHPLYASVLIADAICKANNIELKGRNVSVPGVSVERVRNDKKISIGRTSGPGMALIDGYMTLSLDLDANTQWLTEIASNCPGEFTQASYLDAMLKSYA